MATLDRRKADRRVRLLAVAVMLLMGFGVVTFVAMAALVAQTKEIAEQTKVVARDNRDYTKCIALVFATRRASTLPITEHDLDECAIRVKSR